MSRCEAVAPSTVARSQRIATAIEPKMLLIGRPGSRKVCVIKTMRECPANRSGWPPPGLAAGQCKDLAV